MDFGIEIQQPDGGWRQWQPKKKPQSTLKAKVPRPPATFLSLPRELHTLITSHIDKTTALSLLTVCRQLTSVAEQRIWRDINLVLPQHYGEFPLIRPHGPHSSGYCDWAKKEATAAEERRRMATKEHVKDIIRRGSKERFGTVEHVSIEPAKGVNTAILQLLDFVADNIKSLVISDVEYHVFEEMWRPDPHETFFFKLCDFGLTFSNLAHLDITFARSDYCDDLWTILHLSPSLRTLKIDFTELALAHSFECDSCQRHDRPTTAEKGTLPKLARLELRYFSELEHSGYKILDDLLAHSPELAYLRLDNTDAWEAEESRPHLWDRDRLVYLDWNDSYLGVFTQDAEEERAKRLLAGAGGPAGVLANLETLLISDSFESCSEERLEGKAIPPLERLKTLVIKTASASNPRPSQSTDGATFPEILLGPYHMANNLVERLRTAPSLEIVQFIPLVTSEPTLIPVSDWHQKDVRGVLIRSLRHGGQELFHIRTHTYSVEISDPSDEQRAGAREDTEFSDDIFTSHYEDEDGTKHSKYYDTGDELEWQDSTHFDGHVVPLEIIRQMRKAAGVKAGDWEGRGVEVGEAAWKVLTTWRVGLEKKAGVPAGTASGQEVKQDDGAQGGVTQATTAAIGAA